MAEPLGNYGNLNGHDVPFDSQASPAHTDSMVLNGTTSGVSEPQDEPGLLTPNWGTPNWGTQAYTHTHVHTHAQAFAHTHSPQRIPTPPARRTDSRPPYETSKQHAAEELGEITEELVEQALEVVRETPEGCRDRAARAVLESTLQDIWTKLKQWPNAYIMTKNEFAVFNYYQFIPLNRREMEMARTARSNYWTYGPSVSLQ